MNIKDYFLNIVLTSPNEYVIRLVRSYRDDNGFSVFRPVLDIYDYEFYDFEVKEFNYTVQILESQVLFIETFPEYIMIYVDIGGDF